MSKKWLLGACGALLAGGLFASTASANMVITMTLTGVKDPGTTSFLNLGPWNTKHAAQFTGGLKAATANYVPILAQGQQLRFNIFATIIGADNDPSNEALANVFGNLVTSVAPGATKGATTGGSFAPLSGTLFAQAPYTAAGTSNGLPFTAADGNTNLGSATFTDQFEPYVGFAGQFPPPVYYKWDGQTTNVDGHPSGPPASAAAWLPGTWPDPGDGTGAGATPAGIKVLLAAGVFTAGTVQGGKTDMNFSQWIDSTGKPYYQGALWFEDINFAASDPADPLDTKILSDAQKTAATGDFTVGAPIVLEAIPEPASLSLLGIGALGLLARRRK